MVNPVIMAPFYAETLKQYEVSAFIQMLRVLGKYPFRLVGPAGLDVGTYDALIEAARRRGFTIADLQYEYFPARHFHSQLAYSQFMLLPEFYERFAAFDFMLIAQLDAWVFRDELLYWCEQNYDYIGAPIFRDREDLSSPVVADVGNGGFCLRRIAACIRVLTELWRRDILQVNDFRAIEDILLCTCPAKCDIPFRVAPPSISGWFSWEWQGRRLYQMTDGKLPFGCHYFHSAINWEFWREHIDINSNLRDFGLPVLASV